MTAHRDEHLDLCAARALGSIDEADRLELERHLADGCPECERALAEFGAGVERLAASAPPAMPGPGVKAAVLEQVRAEAARRDHPHADRAAAPSPSLHPKPAPVPLPRRPPVALTWGFAAAAALLAVSTIATWRTAEQLRDELRGARERVARAEIELAAEREWASIATRPGARAVDMVPLTGGGTLPQVRVTYDPGSRRAIVAFESLAAPAGSDFELWAVLDPEGPRSLGVVRPDARGRAVVRVPDAGDPAALTAFALSLERAGGSTDPRKPGGPVVLVGSVKG